jgi:hypothetical protein
MKTKRKNIRFRKQHKTKSRKSVLTKRNNKKRNCFTKKHRMRFKGGMVEEDNCSICLNPFQPGEETITTKCGHKFHKEELLTWCRKFATGKCTCPLDRQNISADVAEYIQTTPTANPSNNIVERRTIEVDGESYALEPGAQLQYIDLSGADLSNLDFTDIDLSRANLSGANLNGAILVRAILIGANLSGAQLIGADLSGAHLITANLTGADLTDATLLGADLRGAIL